MGSPQKALPLYEGREAYQLRWDEKGERIVKGERKPKSVVATYSVRLSWFRQRLNQDP